MNKVCCLILISFFSITVFSQSVIIPKGEYYSEDEGTGYYFIVHDNNEFQISIAKGKITTDSISNLSLPEQKGMVFGLSYTQKKASQDSLTITFSKNFKRYNLSKIYIGATNLINEAPKFEKANSANTADYYEPNEISIKVLKTDYLHLLEESYKRESNVNYIFKIPQNVSEVEITYQPSLTRDIQLNATYDAKKEVVTINEVKRDNPINFYKNFDKYVKEFATPKEIEKNIVWRSEDDIKPISGYDNPYTFKLDSFDSYERAIQTSTTDGKLLLAFHLKEGEKVFDNFSTFKSNYDKKISNLMYSQYKEEFDPYHIYLIKESDKKFIKSLDFKEDQLLVLDDFQSIIYRRKASLTELSKEVMNQHSYAQNDYVNLHLMKRLDDAISASSFDSAKTKAIFKDLASINSYDFFSGHESVTPTSYREKELIKTNSDYYKLQSNLEQVHALFDKLANSHKTDVTVDFEFANIAYKSLTDPYERKLYGNTVEDDYESDLKTIDYLIKFQNDIEDYKAITDEDYSKGYDFYNVAYTISDALNKLAKTANTNALQDIKQSFQKLQTDSNAYLFFLKTYYPQIYLEEYMSYYDATKLHDTNNVVVRLDELYEQTKSKTSWSAFKREIANNANDAAWVVVEKIEDKKMIKEALKWSKTSLNINETNPYYLDTYAQLLYKNGDKKSAIKYQTKAVDIINENTGLYSTSLLSNTTDVLKRMKNGTY
ncbi:hypothetical protein [Psychroserpens sp.]|uniref:hypothetical protein n=1 Tax=Psychroserpens sp. TaxID=2020870 RepID=UPI003C77CE96